MQSKTPYRPLDVAARQIRLLSLKGAEHLDDPIVGDLVHASFLGYHLVEYETISYCWGDATVRSTLEIQGQTIDVPASSAQALRCVRQRDQSRLVWIDAICINQSDNPEKSTQVAMMADIYHSGTRNLIYLGRETDDSAGVDHAVEYCHAVNGCVMRECEGTNDVHPGSSMADQRLRALSDLYSRDWFSRTWVIQEAVLPAKSVIILGSFTLSLKKILCVDRGWRNDVALKNYHVALGGVLEGFKMAGKLGVWVGVFVAMEEGLDRGRAGAVRVSRGVRGVKEEDGLVEGSRDFLSTMLAGLGTAGAFSAWNGFPVATTVRTAKMGAKVGLGFGVAEDVVSMLRGRRIGYVEFVKRHVFGGSEVEVARAAG
ncbi:hypothetical protein B0A55_06811 [Friedmanniomyces simplex]|uniref:Heterokaryon incompatibility domain-containing protein n=1 Tax=Friedmanniomyces simplex TaxID=329884 RepID=A0A4U0X8C2_9PEZI|nr:hypothetical protein B0A55_06811 [Friedmanniomyces simplex]